MLTYWHILFGALFTFIIWVFVPRISPVYLVLIFLSSFLIDFDHYMNSVIKNKKLSLFHAFEYHKKLNKKEIEEKKKGIRRKGDFHIFHTIESHVFVAIVGLLWIGFFFVFIGMVFHSLIDLAESLYRDRFYRREYFFFNWLIKRS